MPGVTRWPKRAARERTAFDGARSWRLRNVVDGQQRPGARPFGLEHKPLVFGGAAALMVVSGVALAYGRNSPCPTDPGAARACRRLRFISMLLYGLALASFALGVAFAFVIPALSR